MKKNYLEKLRLGVIICFLAIFTHSMTFAATNLNLNYDGKTVKYTGVKYSISIDNKILNSDLPGLVLNKAVLLPVRAVFEKLGASVSWSNSTGAMNVTYSGKKIQFINNSTNVKIDGKNIKLSVPAKKINDRLVIPVDFFKNVPELSANIDEKKKSIDIYTIGSISDISYESTENQDIITIKTSKHIGYDAFRMTDPDRIVVDFKNIKGPAKEQITKTSAALMSAIRVGDMKNNKTRVVVDLTGQHDYNIEETADGCKINITKSQYSAITYRNNQDRIYFSLKGIKLTDGGATIKNLFTESYDVENSKYTITIPSGSSISLMDGKMEIGDGLIDTLEIKNNTLTGEIEMVFDTNSECKFLTIYNDKLKATEINVLKPAVEGERLIVIDAGHGGLDSGAVKNDVKEKDLNLDIALKLEKLLKEKNIKTFMLRQDDTYVGLYDRPHIANAMNASLFFSIHNNSYDNAKVSGTETLYFPENKNDPSFSGQKFAKLVHDSMIGNLKMTDRKIKERPNLVVLKYSKMPACLAEIGFISNDGDRKSLQSEVFRQKTAQAICDAIVKANEELDKQDKLAKETKINENQEPNKDTTITGEDDVSATKLVEVNKIGN